MTRNKWLAVFGAVAMADALWTQWMLSVAEEAPFMAGVYSALIIFTGAFVTLAYVQDRRYLIPAMLGAFIGTYLSVAFK